MEQAIKYIENMNQFVFLLLNAHKQVQVLQGRKYDRIECDNTVLFFVDKHTWEIYGAKSSFQHNPRRIFGTLNRINEYNWSVNPPMPLPGTNSELIHTARETEIQKNYKPRGRPKKVITTVQETN